MHADGDEITTDINCHSLVVLSGCQTRQFPLTVSVNDHRRQKSVMCEQHFR